MGGPTVNWIKWWRRECQMLFQIEMHVSICVYSLQRKSLWSKLRFSALDSVWGWGPLSSLRQTKSVIEQKWHRKQKKKNGSFFECDAKCQLDPNTDTHSQTRYIIRSFYSGGHKCLMWRRSENTSVGFYLRCCQLWQDRRRQQQGRVS